MNVGSLFSGIGGIDLGLERAGMSVVWQAESDEWRRGVLRERFPGVPCHDDVRSVQLADRRRHATDVRATAELPEGTNGGCIDLVCGGFPCQDLSVAGRRAGLAGDRSGLFFEFARIVDAVRPRYCLVENVPGLLSSDGGRDFGIVLGTLADIGYGLAWRILDSRFFGVPQRRRRVFILGVQPGGRAGSVRAGEILAVGSRCGRHSQTRREAGEGATESSTGGARGGIAGPLMSTGGKNERGYRIGVEEASAGFIIPVLAPALLASQAKGDPSDQVAYVAAPLSHGSNPNSNAAGRRREDDGNLVAGPLGGGNHGTGRRTEDDPNLVAVSENQRAELRETPYARQLTKGGGKPGQGYPMIREQASVRRLTPTECERLQGFPDGWTAPGPDSRRYAALGDAVTVPVAEWIGQRIMEAT